MFAVEYRDLRSPILRFFPIILVNSAMLPKVLVFRKRILAYSETFISNQARGLQQVQPLLIGLERDSSGNHLLSGLEVSLQSDVAFNAKLARWRLSTTGRPDGRWLELLREHKPKLIHAHFGTSAQAATALARALDIPLLVTFHGYDILNTDLSDRYRKQRERLFNDADFFTSDSDFVRKELIAAGCSPDKVQTHYVGTAVQEEIPARSETPNPSILFVGRLTPHKGCDQLLDIMSKLQSALPEVSLTIVGDGPEKTNLMQQASGLNNVEFLGSQPPERVRQLMQSHWLLCNPSTVGERGWREAFGIVFIEAQALGIPAISYATGGIVEAVADGVSGYTLPLDDRAALYDATLSMLQDPEKRQAMGRAGHKRVFEDFNIDTQCARLETIYQRLMNEKQQKTNESAVGANA